MGNVLLISEDFIKSNSVLDNNLSGKFLFPAILSAQDIELVQTIGQNLVDALKDMVEDGSIDDNDTYRILLDDYVQPFLLYEVLSKVVIPVSYKIANAGVVNVSDDKVENAEYKTIALLKEYYNNEANVYKQRLQHYLCHNRSMYPELNGCDCAVTKAQLDSSSSCSIWLGGKRGK